MWGIFSRIRPPKNRIHSSIVPTFLKCVDALREKESHIEDSGANWYSLCPERCQQEKNMGNDKWPGLWGGRGVDEQQLVRQEQRYHQLRGDER